MVSLYQTASSVGYRQNVTFKDLVVDNLDVDALSVTDLTVFNSIVPQTGGTASVGTTAKPFGNVKVSNFTGNAGYLQTLKLLNTGATNFSNLNYYEEYSNTLTYSGIWASSQTGTAKYVRVGGLVVLNLDDFSSTANTAATITSTAIPSQFRPTDTVSGIVLAYDNGSAVISTMTIGTNGVITIYNGSAGNFTNSGTGGLFYPVVICYPVT